MRCDNESKGNADKSVPRLALFNVVPKSNQVSIKEVLAIFDRYFGKSLGISPDEFTVFFRALWQCFDGRKIADSSSSRGKFQPKEKYRYTQSIFQGVIICLSGLIKDHSFLDRVAADLPQDFVNGIVEEMLLQMDFSFHSYLKQYFVIPVLTKMKLSLCGVYEAVFDCSANFFEDPGLQRQMSIYHASIVEVVNTAFNSRAQSIYSAFTVELCQHSEWQKRDFLDALLQFYQHGSDESLFFYISRVKYVLNQFIESRDKLVDADKRFDIVRSVVDFCWQINQKNIDVQAIMFIYIHLKRLELKLERIVFYDENNIDELVQSDYDFVFRLFRVNGLILDEELGEDLFEKMKSVFVSEYRRIFDFNAILAQSFLIKFDQAYVEAKIDLDSFFERVVKTPRMLARKHLLFASAQSEAAKKRRWRDVEKSSAGSEFDSDSSVSGPIYCTEYEESDSYSGPIYTDRYDDSSSSMSGPIY